jgi:hypothetical protein
MATKQVFNPLTGGFDLISQVTIGTASGLSIDPNQALSLALATTTTPGAVANVGAANGVATLDSAGLIPVNQIPPAALERLIVVANQAARYALTTATAQNGDTVLQTDTGVMYFVKDDTNLGNASGYQVYSAGAASSVAWTGITGIPAPVTSLLGVNTGDVTIGTANGLSLSGQVLSLSAANGGTTGALLSSDWTTFNNKASTSYVDTAGLAYLKIDGTRAMTGDLDIGGHNIINSHSIATTPGTGMTITGDNLYLNATNGGINLATTQAITLSSQNGVTVNNKNIGLLADGVQPTDAVNKRQLDATAKSVPGYAPQTISGSPTQWVLSTNTPTLVDGTGIEGTYYYVTNAPSTAGGMFNGVYYNVGDRIVYHGGHWVNASNLNFDGARSQATYFGLNAVGPWSDTFVVTPSVGSAISIPFTTTQTNSTILIDDIIAAFNSNATLAGLGYFAYREGLATEWNPYYPTAFNHGFLKAPLGVTFTLTTGSNINRYSANDLPALNGQAQTVTNISDPINPRDAANKQYVDKLPGVTPQNISASPTQWVVGTNTPTLVDGTGVEGTYYYVTNAPSTTGGTLNGTYYNVGDRIVYRGGRWVNGKNINLDGARSQCTYFGVLAAGPWSDTFVVTPTGGTAINIPFSTTETDLTLLMNSIINTFNNNPALQNLGYYAYREGAANEWNPYYATAFNHGFLKSPAGQSFTLTTGSNIDRYAGNDLSSLNGLAQKVTNVADPTNAQDAATKHYVDGAVPINYVAAKDGSTTTGWATYANTAGVAPVTGTGGSPTVTFVSSSVTPLVGTSSFLLTKGASNLQGNGASYDFAIDSAFQAKAMTLSFLYSVASGTYASGDVTMWLYDKTNSVLIQPSASTLNNVLGAAQQKCEFQTNSNSTSYRLIFHVSSTSALAYSLLLDSVSVSPNTTNSGAAITDWTLFPAVWTAATTNPNIGTTSTNRAKMRRVGGNLEIEYTLGITAPGTAGSGAYEFGLPVGLQMDSALVTFGALTSSFSPTHLGRGKLVYGGNTQFTFEANAFSATKIRFTFNNGGTPASSEFSAVNSPFASGGVNNITFKASMPIQGWGTSQVLSSDTATNVVDFAATGTGGAVTANVTNIPTSTTLKDSNGAWTGSTYVVPVPGDYVCGIAGLAGAGWTSYVYVNGVSYQPLASMNTSLVRTSILIPSLNAGDIISFRSDASVTLSIFNVNIFRLSGPAQIAASEKVFLQYTGNAGTVLTANVTNIDFATKVVDSHGAWNGTTFTAPRPGMYDIKGSIYFTAVYGNILYAFINGVSNINLISNNACSVKNIVGEVYLLAGQTLTFRAAAAATLVNDNAICWISITSQG